MKRCIERDRRDSIEFVSTRYRQARSSHQELHIHPSKSRAGYDKSYIGAEGFLFYFSSFRSGGGAGGWWGYVGRSA
jgi:hypothetical protein